MKRTLVMSVLLILTTDVASAMFLGPNNFTMSWRTLDSGGGTSSGGDFTLHGTIGQPDASSSSSSTFSIEGGLWASGSVEPTPCPGDLSGDSEVNSDDLFAVLGAWGVCSGCPEDLTADDEVNSDDLFLLLGAWGSCP